MISLTSASRSASSFMQKKNTSCFQPFHSQFSLHKNKEKKKKNDHQKPLHYTTVFLFVFLRAELLFSSFFPSYPFTRAIYCFFLRSLFCFSEVELIFFCSPTTSTGASAGGRAPQVLQVPYVRILVLWVTSSL